MPGDTHRLHINFFSDELCSAIFADNKSAEQKAVKHRCIHRPLLLPEGPLEAGRRERLLATYLGNFHSKRKRTIAMMIKSTALRLTMCGRSTCTHV
jgi:hypothetical protein